MRAARYDTHAGCSPVGAHSGSGGLATSSPPHPPCLPRRRHVAATSPPPRRATAASTARRAHLQQPRELRVAVGHVVVTLAEGVDHVAESQQALVNLDALLQPLAARAGALGTLAPGEVDKVDLGRDRLAVTDQLQREREDGVRPRRGCICDERQRAPTASESAAQRVWCSGGVARRLDEGIRRFGRSRVFA